MPSVTPADVKPVGVVTGQLAQEHAAWCFLNGRNGWWLVHTAHVFCSLAELDWAVGHSGHLLWGIGLKTEVLRRYLAL